MVIQYKSPAVVLKIQILQPLKAAVLDVNLV